MQQQLSCDLAKMFMDGDETERKLNGTRLQRQLLRELNVLHRERSCGCRLQVTVFFGKPAKRE